MSKYSLDKKESDKVNKILNKAEKNGLFEDIICGNEKCGITTDINWRKARINSSGLWYFCKKCGWDNLIGWDIIDESANETNNSKL